MMFKKWLTYCSISLFLLIGFSNCRKIPFKEIGEVPIGTVTYYVNGEERTYDFMSISHSNIDKLYCGFRTNLNGVDYDRTSFYVLLSAETDEFVVKYSTTIDGDQPTERYNVVKGTDFLDIIELDWDNRVCNIRFGATFIREGRDTWNLDYPYRLDCYAIIHTTF